MHTILTHKRWQYGSVIQKQLDQEYNENGFLSGFFECMLGSNIIKVWDILGGGRLLAGFSNHQKTITSLCFDGGHKRLLSGSVDR